MNTDQMRTAWRRIWTVARRELKSLLRDLRRALSRTERAVGLISLRSLGLSG